MSYIGKAYINLKPTFSSLNIMEFILEGGNNFSTLSHRKMYAKILPNRNFKAIVYHSG